MMPKPKKILLVIGLDGATWKVIKPLLKKGKLPFLQRLIKEGVSGNLESTMPPMSAPAWTSFQTGVTPADHGVFDFVDYQKGSWGDRLINPQKIPFKRFWDFLETEKKTYCLLNMPFTYPPAKKKHGLIISSLFTPPGERFVSDPKIQKELEALDYQVDLDFEGDLTDLGKKEAIYQKILKMTERRFEAAKLLATKKRWDFFFILFRSPDQVQHFFWNSKKTEDYYQLLDSYLEALYSLFKKRYPGRINLIILSDHGFHQAASYQFSLNTWLQQIAGPLVVSGSNWKKIRGWYHQLKEWGISKERFLLLRRLAKRGLKQEAKALIEFRQESLVWGFRFGLFLDKEKLKENYRQLRERLIEQLSALKYRQRPVFQWVKKEEEIYFGSKIDGVPDILFLAHEEFDVDATSFNPEIFLKRKNFYWQGDHFAGQQGIFIAHGPAFPKKKAKVDYKIWQVTPLMLRIMGLKIPFYMDEKEKTLTAKIAKSKKVIRRTLNQFKGHCGLAWTGGKDSMVMLDLVRRVAGKNLPEVMFIDHGLHFPETYDFVKKMKKKWHLKLVIGSDKRTGEELKREKNFQKKRELARIFKIRSIANIIQAKKWQALLVGIRWDEHPARSKEKYFSKRENHLRVHPLLHFQEGDIWAYIKKFKIPYNPLYDQGYRSLGEKPFTKPVKDKSFSERAGREKDKEKIMARLRALGYF